MIDPCFLLDWVQAILENYDNAITDPTEETA